MGRISSIYNVRSAGINKYSGKKGLITKDEILEEVEVVKKEMEEEIRRMGREK